MKVFKFHVANYPSDICEFLNVNKIDQSQVMGYSLTHDKKQIVYYWQLSKIHKE